MKRQTNPETHQLCRSLLQKAVRRGCKELVRVTARHLDRVGDGQWLRRRTGVIAFEECWPFGGEFKTLPDMDGAIDRLVRISLSVKNKDAAGLGSLGYELSRGDHSVLDGTGNDKDVEQIAYALEKADQFWAWVRSHTEEWNRQFLESAEKSYGRGGWPWDRAFMLAAAFLVIRSGKIPQLVEAGRYLSYDDFPFWIAIDKHTDLGKQKLKQLAVDRNIPYRDLSWINFYFESALSNMQEPSYWWAREQSWRMQKLGLSVEQALQRWKELRADYSELIDDEAQELRAHIDEDRYIRDYSQLSLL